MQMNMKFEAARTGDDHFRSWTTEERKENIRKRIEKERLKPGAFQCMMKHLRTEADKHRAGDVKGLLEDEKTAKKIAAAAGR